MRNALPQYHVFEYLFPSWLYCLGRFRKCDISGGNKSLGVDLRVYSFALLLIHSLYFLFLFLLLPTMMESYPSGAINQNKLLYKSLLVMVFYDSNRKVMVIVTNENIELRKAVSHLQIHIKQSKCVQVCPERESYLAAIMLIFLTLNKCYHYNIG